MYLPTTISSLEVDREVTRVCVLKPDIVRTALPFVISTRVVELFETRAQQLREVRTHSLPSSKCVQLWLKLCLHMLCLQVHRNQTCITHQENSVISAAHNIEGHTPVRMTSLPKRCSAGAASNPRGEYALQTRVRRRPLNPTLVRQAARAPDSRSRLTEVCALDVRRCTCLSKLHHRHRVCATNRAQGLAQSRSLMDASFRTCPSSVSIDHAAWKNTWLQSTAPEARTFLQGDSTRHAVSHLLTWHPVRARSAHSKSMMHCQAWSSHRSQCCGFDMLRQLVARREPVSQWCIEVRASMCWHGQCGIRVHAYLFHKPKLKATSLHCLAGWCGRIQPRRSALDDRDDCHADSRWWDHHG